MTAAATMVRTGMHPARVCVVILNWNGKRDTLECLGSVFGMSYPNFEVVVVDNGSDDDSVAAIKQAFPAVTIVETGANLGYAGGNNAGMRHAIEHEAEYVLLLNNDTVVDPSLLAALVRASVALGGESILAARIYLHSEPQTLWYAGGRVVRRTALTYHEGIGVVDRRSDAGPAETDYASGCAFFVSTRLLSRLGLFDERFFLVYEETDFCARARQIGVKSYVVPDAKVWHKVSVSFGGPGSPAYTYFVYRNRLLWAEKHLSLHLRLSVYGHVVAELLRALMPPRFHLSRSSSDGFLSRLRVSLREYRAAVAAKYAGGILRARAQGVRDYVLRRFGKPASGNGRLRAGDTSHSPFLHSA